MEKLIFRHDEDDSSVEKVKISSKKPVERRRKDMTPLIDLFNESEKLKLTRKFFKNDSGQFHTFINEINTKMTWHEAFHTIETNLSKRKVDIMSDEARQLTDRVYRLFFPDDISID
jgi:hypothetical protein